MLSDTLIFASFCKRSVYLENVEDFLKQIICRFFGFLQLSEFQNEIIGYGSQWYAHPRLRPWLYTPVMEKPQTRNNSIKWINTAADEPGTLELRVPSASPRLSGLWHRMFDFGAVNWLNIRMELWFIDHSGKYAHPSLRPWLYTACARALASAA